MNRINPKRKTGIYPGILCILCILVHLPLLVGCQSPRPPAPEIDFTCRVRPCIVRSLGITHWADAAIAARQEVAARIFALAGVQLAFEPPVFLDEDGVFRPNCPEQRLRLTTYAKLWADEHGELLVHYVDRLWLGDRECGGLSNYPSNLPGSVYQWGVLISTNSYHSVLAHELGHSFNLRHPWEVGQSAGEYDCVGWEKYCDIMSYCADRPIWPDCIDRSLRADQIDTVRSWCTVEPRLRCVTATAKAVEQIRQRGWTPEYTTNTEMVEAEPATATDARIERLLNAIEEVECEGIPKEKRAEAVGDHGKSRGPYQIGFAYWRDATRSPDNARSRARYRREVADRMAARRTVVLYWKLYVPGALAEVDLERLARLHNGGCNRWKSKAAGVYWQKVREVINGTGNK